MTGERVNSRCPACGGQLTGGEATIPYVLDGGTVVVIKNVPAEICGDCNEAFTTGAVTDQVTHILRQLKELDSEVSIVSYAEQQLA
jgi:YgiT-type zinc finger domain-containing protein